jgi:hypothetical protein
MTKPEWSGATMKLKHAILEQLGREELKRIVDQLEIEEVDRRSVDDMRRVLSRSRRATPPILLEYLGETEVKAVCELIEVESVGRRSQLIERLLATETDRTPTRSASEESRLASEEPTPTRSASEESRLASEEPTLTRSASEESRLASEELTLTRSASEEAQRTTRDASEPRATRSGGKRAIEHYEHTDKTRMNNPPVGLVTPENDPDAGKKRYAYDPHLDPTLVWAGKAEQNTIEVPTVSLHVHERIDPRTIIEAVRKRNGTLTRSASEATRRPTLTRSASEETTRAAARGRPSSAPYSRSPKRTRPCARRSTFIATRTAGATA